MTITGLGYKDTSDFNGLPHLSMAGGAPILLSGLNFASSAAANTWKFDLMWIEGATVFGPAMTSKLLILFVNHVILCRRRLDEL